MESKHRDLHVCATPPPPRLRRFKKPRKTNVQLDGHFGDCSPLFFRGVHISTRPKTLIFAYSFQSLKYPGLPARDDGSMWHLWCDVRPSFKAGWVGRLRLPCIYMIGVHVLLWRHWAVTLLHIKKTFLILHLRVNALFWCMGFQLTQCPAMFQNTKSGPLRDAIVEKAQNNCWEGPVKKRIRSNFWYHVSSSCCHIMQNIMKNNSKQLGRSLKDHLLFHLAISVDSSAQGACFESFFEIWLGAVSCFVFFWFASNDSDHHRFEIQRFCWHIRNSTEVGVHKL